MKPLVQNIIEVSLITSLDYENNNTAFILIIYQEILMQQNQKYFKKEEENKEGNIEDEKKLKITNETSFRLPQELSTYRVDQSLSIDNKEKQDLITQQQTSKPDYSCTGIYKNSVRALFKQNKVDEGIKQFQKAIQLDPTNHEFNNWLGNQLCRLGKFSQSIKWYKRAIWLSPSYLSAYNNISNTFIQINELNLGMKLCKKINEREEWNYQIQMILGKGYSKMNNINYAIACFSMALRIKQSYQAWYYLGNQVQKKQERKTAMNCYLISLQMNPFSLMVQQKIWNELRRIQFIEKNESQQIKQADKKFYSQIAYQLGKCFAKQRKYDQAIECFLKAFQLNSSSQDIILFLGFLLQLRNRIKKEQAIQFYLKTIDLDPSYQIAYELLGHTLKKMEKNSQAIKYYKIAYFLQPEYRRVYYIAQTLLKMADQVSKNIQFFKKIREKYYQNSSQAWNNLGNAYCSLGSRQQAIACYKSAIEQNPNIFIYYSNLGSALYRIDRDDDAILYLKQAIKIQPNCEIAFYNLGNIYSKKGKINQAIQAFQTVLKINPDCYQAYQGLGYCQRIIGNYDQSLIYYKKALHLNSNNQTTFVKIGNLLSEIGQINLAIKCYKKAICINQTFQSVYINFGLLYLQKIDNPQRAIQCYQKALHLSKNKFKFYHELGLAYFKAKEYQQAVEYFLKAISMNQKNQQTFNNLATAFERLNQYNKAIYYYQKAIQANPNDYNAYGNIGILLINKYRYQEAIEYLQKAISIYDKDHNLFRNLGCILILTNKIEKAIQCFQTALQINKNDSSVYYNYAAALERINKHKEAIEFYQKTIQLNPTHHLAFNQLGNALRCIQKLQEAIICYYKSIYLFPTKSSTYANLGHAFYSKGQIHKTIQCYRTSINLNPNSPTIYNYLGMALQKVNKIDQAVKCYISALNLDKNFYLASYNLNKAQKKEKKMVIQNISSYQLQYTKFTNLDYISEDIYNQKIQKYQNQHIQKIQSYWNTKQLFKIHQILINFSQQLTINQKSHLWIDFIKFAILTFKEHSIAKKYIYQCLCSEIIKQNKIINLVITTSENFYSSLIRHFLKIITTTKKQKKKKQNSNPDQICLQQSELQESQNKFNDPLIKNKNKQPQISQKQPQIKKQKTSIDINKEFFKKQSQKLSKEKWITLSYSTPEYFQSFSISEYIKKQVRQKSSQLKKKKKQATSNQKYQGLMLKILISELKSKARKINLEKSMYNKLAYFNIIPSNVSKLDKLLKDTLYATDLEDLKGIIFSLNEQPQQLQNKCSKAQFYQAQTFSSSIHAESSLQNYRPLFSYPFNLKISQQKKYEYLLSEEQLSKLRIIKHLKAYFRSQYYLLAWMQLVQKAERIINTEIKEKNKQNSYNQEWLYSQNELINEKQMSNQKLRSAMQCYEDYLPSYEHQQWSLFNDQSSSASKNIIQQYQMTIFPSKFDFDQIKYLEKNKKQNIQILFFKNYLHLIQYLSNKRHHFQWISKHYFNLNNKYTNQKQEKGYYFTIEKGLKEFILEKYQQSDQNYIKLLQQKGQIFSWIACLVKGILELQEAGIFHSDLCIRNTIKLKTKQGKLVYKIIDFDNAFKVFGDETEMNLLKCTKQILQFWLKLDNQLSYRLGKKIFRSINEQFLKNLINSLKKEQNQTKSIEMALQHLNNYMFISYKYQLLTIMKHFLQNAVEEEELKQKIKVVQAMISTIPVEKGQENKKHYLEVIRLAQQLQK